jgi:hypothetical protein
MQWVSFPDGSHLTGRAPVGYSAGGGAAALPAFGARAGSPFNAASQEKPFYSLLDDRDEALLSITHSVRGFYVLAVIHILFGLLYTPAFIVGAALGAAALAVHKTHSVIAAGLLMLYGGYRVWDLLTGFASVGGRSGVFITIAIVVTAYRALDATLALNGRFKQ